MFKYTAIDGRSHTVISDVYVPESEIRFGERLQVLYWPRQPESARIDAFEALWTLPLVAGGVGGAFSVVPAIVWVSWLRRRAAAVEPDKREAASAAANEVSLGFRRTLGAVIIVAGGVLLAMGLGVIPSDLIFNASRVPVTVIGTLLVASGLQVGQWTAPGGRFSHFLGGLLATSMAVMFAWVAIYGDAANFHGAVGAGGRAVALHGPAALGRILFGAVSILAGLASLWSWKQLFRSS